MSKKPELQKAVLRYSLGFALSLVFTVAAFWLVMQHAAYPYRSLPEEVIIPIVVGLAIVQLVVQLVFFLHLGRETRPRWNLVVFLFMILVLVIVVFGSLWIMDNLNYNMMSGSEVKEYLNDHPGSF